MAEKNDKDLIGFDPLAWMNESEDEAKTPSEEKSVAITSDNENESLNEEGKLILDATLNIQNVTHLYEQARVLLEGQDKIEIDASSVTTIDTATLQLLIVLKQSAVKLGKEIVFDFPSDKFIDSAELLGLAEMLEIDQAAAGFF